MYISINWLEDFLKIPAKIKPEEISEQLTKHTVEVEGLVKQAEQFNKVVVGKVLEVAKHPNADRLRLAVVDVKKNTLHIVCGAPNLAVGQLVPVALVGAVLPNGLEIKESEIRGEKSQGMICAEDELGLGKNHEGIIVLSIKAKVGQPLAEYLKANDIVLEVDNKSLSNRPDLWSHYGLARELSAIFDLAIKPYDKFFNHKFHFLSAQENKLEVKVEDKKLCPRYTAVKIENISVAESPAWLKERLIAVNQRPVNNIVDLTNYVMLECGQPLHAFDAAKVKKILVRSAAKNEVLETLDDKERVLTTGDLLITDGKNILAIAGVMGGKNSEINPGTSALVLESANFLASAIRQTSQRLGLRTEASVRFEKSLDPILTEVALRRFLTLLKEICPAMKISSALVDINSSTEKKIEIDLSLDWLTKKIGQEIPSDQALSFLTKLGFIVSNEKEAMWRVSVPSWRATKDISTKEDIAEEILRLYGYDKIESQLLVGALSLPEENPIRGLERRTKSGLSLKYSLTEVYNYSFVGPDQLNKLKIEFSNYLFLANPLSDNQTMLRQSLAPGLISNLKTNQAKADEISLFEIGNVFFNSIGNIRKDQTSEEWLPYQEKHLGILLAGSGDIFGRLKGIINDLLQMTVKRSALTIFSPLEIAPGWADDKVAAGISLLGKEIGLVALVSRGTTDNLNLKKPAVLAEINFSALTELALSLPPFHFQEESKYPAVARDVAFVVDQKILYNDLKKELIDFNPLIKSVEIFDVYAGDKLAMNQKSLAFHLTYQAEDRTLRAEEVDRLQTELVARLAEKFAAKLRDF